MNKQIGLTVGIIIDTSLKIPPNTGVTYRLYFLSKKMAELGMGIKIFLCNRNIKNDKDASILFDKSNIEYHIIPENIFYDNKKLFKIISKSKLDILQFEDCQTLIRCKEIWNLLNIPVCLEMHDVEATLKDYLGFSSKDIKDAEIITKTACSLASQVICMTSLDFNELIIKNSIIKKKLSILPNPINMQDFPFYGPSLEDLSIIFIGNMFYWPNNNAAKFIISKIYPKLKNIKNLKIYFVGMAPKYFSKYNKNKQIIFTGSVDNLNKYLEMASIALCPITEGSGMKVKILNYCSAGLPTITTNIGASGYEKIKSLIIEDNIENYANIIKNLYFDKKNLFKIGENNRKYLAKNFDINKIAQKTITLYKKVIKNHKQYSILKINSNIIDKPLWLKENRLNSIKNKNYYIIKNGKIIFKEKIA